MWMYASVGPAGSERPTLVTAGGERCLPLAIRSWRCALEEGMLEAVLQEAAARPDSDWTPLAAMRLGPPVPDPSKIVCVGLNYRDHAEEQGKTPPEAPLLFAKAPSCLIGPADPIILPPQEPNVDAEAELCLVVGKACRGVSPERARSCLLGYTVMNDLSGRSAQYGDRQWFRGKSFDTFGPCGPWIVPAADLPDPESLEITARWGERWMQRGSTAQMIFGVDRLLSYISFQMTLFPGDLVATGTPAGVGVFRDPPVFLAPGDRVTIEIERIGRLDNPVVAGPAASPQS